MELLSTTRLFELLKEDMPYGDVTTDLLIDSKTEIIAEIISKDEGVVAGISIVQEFLENIGIKTLSKVKDGDEIKKGTTLMVLQGSAKKILGTERIILNLLMHMSGIATVTRSIISKATDIYPNIRVAATRKTLPGLRYFEKKAVEIGGGDTHRFSLSDMILIKKNHIRIIGDVAEAVKIARNKSSFSKKIEVEVTTAEDALKAAKAGVDIIMLDNVTPEEVKRAIDLLKEKKLRNKVLIEVSGGINENNIVEYVKYRPDILSLSLITLNAKSLDMSLVVKEVVK